MEISGVVGKERSTRRSENDLTYFPRVMSTNEFELP
jgi:hypothetical protein